MVSPGIFRSGFPTHHHVPFLQRLGLRTIINVAQEAGLAHKGEFKEWVSQRDIEVVTCDIIPSREPFVVPDDQEIRKALYVLLDPSRHPVLVHSIRGDGPLSVVFGILRRLQHWSLTSIFDEARRFASSGVPLLDLQTIELFDVTAAAQDADLSGAKASAEALDADASAAVEAAPAAERAGGSGGGGSQAAVVGVVAVQ